MLYTDDMILLSSTRNGLKNSLNILNKFCVSWKLAINQKKTKSIIFNSNGKSFLNIFKLNENYLETVI